MTLKHNFPLYSKGRLIRNECWSFEGVGYRNDAERRLLRATFNSQADALAAARNADVTPIGHTDAH